MRSCPLTSILSPKGRGSYVIKIIFFCLLLAHAGKSTAGASSPLRIVISPQPLSPEGQGNFVGSKQCPSCHEAIYQNWLGSPHARAWQTLKAKQAEANPSCLRCHSTGYGSKGGFSNPAETPHLAGVQCESCHGPASGHLVQKTDWTWIKADCTTCRVRRICMACHTPTHSPHFNLNAYLDKIRHPN